MRQRDEKGRFLPTREYSAADLMNAERIKEQKRIEYIQACGRYNRIKKYVGNKSK